MTLFDAYRRLGSAALLSQARAEEIITAARPMALNALGRTNGSLRVTARMVEPSVARGGCLIPAWPMSAGDGRVIIEFVADWGVMLSAWRCLIGDSPEIDDLLQTGQRQWIGIANDVLQLFVPDPPEGTYSMVRHHALMLAAATIWLGPDATSRWLAAHKLAARSFLRPGQDLWSAVESVELGLAELLADPQAHQSAEEVVAWLDEDEVASELYQAYLAAASLGVAALLDSVAVWAPHRLTELVLHRHSDPDFNRNEIERFALGIRA